MKEGRRCLLRLKTQRSVSAVVRRSFSSFVQDFCFLKFLSRTAFMWFLYISSTSAFVRSFPPPYRSSKSCREISRALRLKVGRGGLLFPALGWAGKSPVLSSGPAPPAIRSFCSSVPRQELNPAAATTSRKEVIQQRQREGHQRRLQRRRPLRRQEDSHKGFSASCRTKKSSYF